MCRQMSGESRAGSASSITQPSGYPFLHVDRIPVNDDAEQQAHRTEIFLLPLAQGAAFRSPRSSTCGCSTLDTPAFCQLATQCVTNWRYRAFPRLATQRVTFLSVRPLGKRHGVLGKFTLICPGRIIGPCSRSSAEMRAISMRSKVSSTAGQRGNWSAKSGRCCSSDCSKAATRRRPGTCE